MAVSGSCEDQQVVRGVGPEEVERRDRQSEERWTKIEKMEEPGKVGTGPGG